MRRHPRAGLRDRWAAAVVASNVGYAHKTLLLHLVVTHRVTPHGNLTFHRETVADEMHIHKQRVSALIKDARMAGLLDRRGGGYTGRTTEYQCTIPDTRGARISGTFDEEEAV